MHVFQPVALFSLMSNHFSPGRYDYARERKVILLNAFFVVLKNTECYLSNSTVYAELPVVRRYPAVIVLGDKKDTIWMTGGYEGQNAQSSTHFIKPGGVVVSGPSLPMPLTGHCIVRIDEDRFLLLGGHIGSGTKTYSKRTFIYSHSEKTFIIGPDLEVARERPACGAVRNQVGTVFIIAIGGNCHGVEDRRCRIKRDDYTFTDQSTEFTRYGDHKFMLGTNTSHPIKSFEIQIFWLSGPSFPSMDGIGAVSSVDGKSLYILGGVNQTGYSYDNRLFRMECNLVCTIHVLGHVRKVSFAHLFLVPVGLQVPCPRAKSNGNYIEELLKTTNYLYEQKVSELEQEAQKGQKNNVGVIDTEALEDEQMQSY